MYLFVGLKLYLSLAVLLYELPMVIVTRESTMLKVDIYSVQAVIKYTISASDSSLGKASHGQNYHCSFWPLHADFYLHPTIVQTSVLW